MAISRVATSSGVVTFEEGAVAKAIPGTVAEGQFVVVHIATDGLDSFAPVSDGTTAYTDIYQVGNNVPGGRSAYKILGSTPDTTVTIGVADGNRDLAYIIEVWEGVDTTTPLDGVTPSASATATPPARDTNTDGAFSCIVHYLDDDDAAGSGGLPSGYTGFLEQDTGNASASVGATVTVGHQEIATAGTVTPGAFTGLSTDDEISLHFVLKPAAGGGGTDNATADDVESASEVSLPSVGQEHAITANDVQSTSEVTEPAVGQVHAVTADDVESASELSEPVAGTIHVLAADDVESASEVTEPSVGQVHALLADDTEAASEVTEPAAGQVHALFAENVESASSVTEPDVGQVHAVLADDVESASEASEPTAAEVDESATAVLADDVEAQSEVSTPSVGQVHVLTANDVESGSEVSEPTLNRTATTQRGGGVPHRNAREEFWRRKAEEWFEERYPEAIEVAKKPKKERKKAVKEILDDLELFESAPIAIAERVDYAAQIMKRIAQPNFDSVAVYTALAAEMERIDRERTLRRRRRDLEAVIMVAA